MGYIPPPPGVFITLEAGVNYIDVTCLEDGEPRHIRAYQHSFRNMVDRESDLHRARMQAEHEQTMRDAKRGTWILAAMLLAIIGVIAQAAGMV